MASKNEICNLALGHLGHSIFISNVESDNSPEAAACRLFYDYALECTLKGADWPFAGRTVTLALVSGADAGEYGFAYRYPASALKIRRIVNRFSGGSFTPSEPPPYSFSSDNGGLLLLTNVQEAVVSVTTHLTQVSLYPADFCMALSYMLASLIAPKVTKSDSFNMSDKMLQRFNLFNSKAVANASNEIQNQRPAEAESVRARG